MPGEPKTDSGGFPSAAAADRVGTVIDGRYKITEMMAAGSMGSVYRAERVPVGKLVAVKFLHSNFAGDPEFQARFERETRVMSKLNHPNCVSVLDFGVWQGEPYLVMDFVDGTTLRHRLDEGPMEPRDALLIARQMLSGLAHAHAQDVFHRDIKPANVMISEEIGHGERVRILDFGLARLQGNVGRDATQINMVVGTPNYMAPEQTVPGGVIDARTDLYAAGVVLYEMIVGERPFHAEDTLQLLGMHRAAPIPRLANTVKKGVEVPVGTQELIDRAMAKSPDERYQSAIEFAAGIDEVLEGKLDPTMIEEATIPKSGRVERRIAGKSGPSRKTGKTTGVAPTVEVDQSALDEQMRRVRVHRSFGGTLVLAFLVVGGIAAGMGFLIKRAAGRKAAVTDRVNTSPTARDAGVKATAGKEPEQITKATPDAAQEVVAAPPPMVDAGVAVAAVAPPDAYQRVDDAGLPIYGDPDQEDKLDPEKAEDPDPEQAKAATAQDEEPNAPKTVAEAEKREEAEKRDAPQKEKEQLATTLHDAVMLIKAGKKTLAVQSLRQLWQKNQKSAYIPFLLGNLYFDRTWWSVAMDHYRAAIKQNKGYKRNPVLNRNIIRMLASGKTRGRATYFLRAVIGKVSKPYLRMAARNDPNPVVRKQAALLARRR